VILPPLTENLNSATMKLLDDFGKAGGTIYSASGQPSRVDGNPSDRANELMQTWSSKFTFKEGQDLVRNLRAMPLPDAFAIIRQPSDKGILFHHRRQLADGQLLFLVNTSIEAPSVGVIKSGLCGVEKWNLQNGQVEPYPFEVQDKGLRARFELPPSGSLLLFLSQGSRKPAAEAIPAIVTLPATGAPVIRRVEPNVLTLDYVNITAGGQTRTNLYFYRANQLAFQKNGMDRNPWDSAVQFRDELITKTFPADSGFTASYKFVIEEKVPAKLDIVIERPDLYTITCNGQPVTATPGAWWLDKAFGRIEIAKVARVGENVVTIKAAPFTICHELEPAYVLGEFALKATETGFVIVPDQPLKLGGWNEQGHPFYSAGITYLEQFDVLKPAGRYLVSAPGWHGSVARVIVNGQPAGYIAYPPWECDVTHLITPGANTVDVQVIGTLKNTLGPHHAGPGLGSAWPGMFQQGPETGPPPGAKYATVGYGLFEPFVLKQVK
jgi:hypothetical protein